MIEPLTERLKLLGVHLYQGTRDEDILIAQWWDSICASDEIEVLVTSHVYTLSNFYTLFKPPAMMAYSVRDEALESVNWATPTGTSEYAVYFSSWCLPQMRGTKRHAVIMSSLYELLFAMGKKTIIGMTKQRKLLALHEKMGYSIVGSIPNLFDESEAWILYSTEPAFKASLLYAVATKALRKENMNAGQYRTTEHSSAILGVS